MLSLISGYGIANYTLKSSQVLHVVQLLRLRIFLCVVLPLEQVRPDIPALAHIPPHLDREGAVLGLTGEGFIRWRYRLRTLWTGLCKLRTHDCNC
jgi:hypothetical protein